MSKSIQCLALISCLLVTSTSMAKGLGSGKFLFEFGPYFTEVGETQSIGIEGLLGNEYVADGNTEANGMFGLGYYWNGINDKKFILDYGLNIYYMFETTSSGDVVQEHMFTNLGYEYQVSHVPLYAGIKAAFLNDSRKAALTFNGGIGPNFVITDDYIEHSLDGVTVPDNAFDGETVTQFSAMAGIGFKWYDLAGGSTLEFGYRFFYLGEGELSRDTHQLQDDLETGTIFANAFIFTLTL